MPPHALSTRPHTAPNSRRRSTAAAVCPSPPCESAHLLATVVVAEAPIVVLLAVRRRVGNVDDDARPRGPREIGALLKAARDVLGEIATTTRDSSSDDGRDGPELRARRTAGNTREADRHTDMRIHTHPRRARVHMPPHTSVSSLKSQISKRFESQKSR
eukprot:5226722-Prymnesium_polylepis.1